MYWFIHPLIYSFMYLFTYICIYLFTYLSIYLFVNVFIRVCIHIFSDNNPSSFVHGYAYLFHKSFAQSCTTQTKFSIITFRLYIIFSFCWNGFKISWNHKSRINASASTGKGILNLIENFLSTIAIYINYFPPLSS